MRLCHSGQVYSGAADTKVWCPSRWGNWASPVPSGDAPVEECPQGAVGNCLPISSQFRMVAQFRA